MPPSALRRGVPPRRPGVAQSPRRRGRDEGTITLSLRLEATAFGRATLEGSADPARCFRPCDLGPPSVSTPAGQGRGGRAGGGVEAIRRAGQRSRWETDPVESVRVRHRVARKAVVSSLGPEGAFRYVSRPPLGGFSKPRPTAVVGYSARRAGVLLLARRAGRERRCAEARPPREGALRPADR